VSDFDSGPGRRELQNGTNKRVLAANAAEFDPSGPLIVINPLFDMPTEEDLAADPHRRPEVGADLGGGGQSSQKNDQNGSEWPSETFPPSRHCG
jgi:hypothetical protein